MLPQNPPQSRLDTRKTLPKVPCWTFSRWRRGAAINRSKCGSGSLVLRGLLRIASGLVKGLDSRRFRSMDSLAARLPQNKE
jgi:hypothetical protein